MAGTPPISFVRTSISQRGSRLTVPASTRLCAARAARACPRFLPARPDMPTLDMDHAMAGHDEFYQALLAAHAMLSKAESDAFNARLLLILANHVGDLGVLRAALAVASASRPPDESAN